VGACLPIRGVVAVIQQIRDADLVAARGHSQTSTAPSLPGPAPRLLVIRRAQGIVAGGSWCFPGGAIEPGESPPAAVIREVREEIGIAVEPVEQVWDWQSPDGGLILSWWSARILHPGTPPRPDPMEVAELRWAIPDEIRRLTPLLPSNLAFLDLFWPG
jgi:8-oxo-dGTP diphosphatase